MKVGDLTVEQLKDIVREILSETLERKLLADNCPVCDSDGYLKDPVTGVEIACFCRTGSHILCVKNPPELFA